MLETRLPGRLLLLVIRRIPWKRILTSRRARNIVKTCPTALCAHWQSIKRGKLFAEFFVVRVGRDVVLIVILDDLALNVSIFFRFSPYCKGLPSVLINCTK